jgi:hypothetical protein
MTLTFWQSQHVMGTIVDCLLAKYSKHKNSSFSSTIDCKCLAYFDLTLFFNLYAHENMKRLQK